MRIDEDRDPVRRSPLATLLPLGGWVLLGLTLILGWCTGDGPQDLFDRGASAHPIAPRGALAADEQETIGIFESARDSVVFIATSELARASYFSRNLVEVPRGSGSGFVWDESGYVVTNFHVVQDSAGVEVTLSDGSVHEARLVGTDPLHDVAVLKIEAPRKLLRPLVVGSSTDLRVGQRVLAIGNPFGLDWTLTSGIISGLDRTIQSVVDTRIRGVIQTDAAINPGNSGGPLLDSAGRLIGINTAILSPSGSSAGIGFAVPVDTVNRIVPQIIRSGQPERAGLGIVPAPDTYARRLGVVGVIVGEVNPGSAAATAGLRSARQERRGLALDIIVAIDAQPIRDNADLFEALDGRRPGERVQVQILRGEEKQTLEIQLQDLR